MIPAISSGGDRAGRWSGSIKLEDRGGSIRTSAISCAGYVNQCDLRAGYGCIAMTVKDHARRIHQNGRGHAGSAAAGQRGHDLIVNQHFHDLVSRDHRVLVGVARGYGRQNAEDASVRPGFSCGESFKITRQLRLQRDRLGFRHCRISIAARGIHLYPQRRADGSGANGFAEGFVKEIRDARRRPGYRDVHFIGKRGGIRAVVVEDYRAVAHHAGSIAVDRDPEA